MNKIETGDMINIDSVMRFAEAMSKADQELRDAEDGVAVESFKFQWDEHPRL